MDKKNNKINPATIHNLIENDLFLAKLIKSWNPKSDFFKFNNKNI